MIDEIACPPKQEGCLTVHMAWHQGKFVADWLAIERSDGSRASVQRREGRVTC